MSGKEAIDRALSEPTIKLIIQLVAFMGTLVGALLLTDRRITSLELTRPTKTELIDAVTAAVREHAAIPLHAGAATKEEYHQMNKKLDEAIQRGNERTTDIAVIKSDIGVIKQSVQRIEKRTDGRP